MTEKCIPFLYGIVDRVTRLTFSRAFAHFRRKPFLGDFTITRLLCLTAAFAVLAACQDGASDTASVPVTSDVETVAENTTTTAVETFEIPESCRSENTSVLDGLSAKSLVRSTQTDEKWNNGFHVEIPVVLFDLGEEVLTAYEGAQYIKFDNGVIRAVKSVEPQARLGIMRLGGGTLGDECKPATTSFTAYY